jgi:hypothetical protein
LVYWDVRAPHISEESKKGLYIIKVPMLINKSFLAAVGHQFGINVTKSEPRANIHRKNFVNFTQTY